MPIRIAINGYGRIGRDLHRQLLEVEGIEVVAINSRADSESHAYLLKYDSLYGKCKAEISVDGPDMVVNGKKVFVYQIARLEDLDWAKHEIDIVIEATGNFTSKLEADMHLKAGEKSAYYCAL